MNDPTKTPHVCPDCQYPDNTDENGVAHPVLTAGDHLKAALHEALGRLDAAAGFADELGPIDFPPHANPQARRERALEAIARARGSVALALRGLD